MSCSPSQVNLEPLTVGKVDDELDSLLEEFGDEFFDDDFLLSSPKESRERQKQPQAEAKAGGKKQPAKEPSKPEAKAKVPMVVPHNVAEVTKLVHLASGEMWRSCRLGRGPRVLTDAMKPHIPLGIYAEGEDLETSSKRSYRMVSHGSKVLQ